MFQPRLSLAILALLSAVVALHGLIGPVLAQTEEAHALVIKVDGVIDPVTQRFISRALHRAEEDRAEVMIIQLDTPGGLLSSTLKIVQQLLGAKVPVVVYVSPPGARAGSAGTFITAAANFAVMAPGTNIGAATPISSSGQDLGKTLESKVTNDAAAKIRSIAQERGRNPDKLEETVRKASSFTANEAVESHMVDFIAKDLDDLLAQLDGKVAQTPAGPITLHTASLAKHTMGMSLRERFVSVIADPNLVSILLLAGVIAIFVEFLHPGLVVPAVLGVISLVLAFLALGSLPFHWAGVALLGLAAVLIFLEIHSGTAFLGVAAVVSFVLGALLLFSVGTPSFPGAPVQKISLWLIGILAGLMAGFTLLIVTAVVRSKRVRYPSGAARLIGQVGQVSSDLAPTGTVQLSSELWSAISENKEVIPAGEWVTVVALEGLTLKVRKA